MLTYHPIFDSNHCLFRIIYLLNRLDKKSHEIDKIRLFDFYLCAPYSIKLFRANSSSVRQKKNAIIKELSSYDEIDNSKALFFDAKNLQTTVLNYLSAKNVISAEEYRKNLICLTTSGLVSVVENITGKSRSIISSVMEIIEDDLQEIPVFGVDGLKHRSNIMEYRYDIS